MEDLRRVIIAMEEKDDELVAEAGGSPFCREIHEAPFPEGFKLPSIKAYEGKADPQDHLDHFNECSLSDLAMELRSGLGQ